MIVGVVALQSHAASAPQNQPLDSLATHQANLETLAAAPREYIHQTCVVDINLARFSPRTFPRFKMRRFPFLAAAAGPAELLRITMSPPHCVRFFATSALESTLCKQIEEWQVERKKSAKTLPHVHWLLSLAASCCAEA